MSKKPSKSLKIILSIIGGLAGLCIFICIGFYALGKWAESDPSVQATGTARAATLATATPTRKSTATSTSTPIPTDTLDPSITPPTQTNTLTPTDTFTPTATPTYTPTPTKTPLPTNTPIPPLTVGEIYKNFKDMTAFQFEEYKKTIYGKKVIDTVRIGNVSDDGKLLLSGPWSPILFNISDFCVGVVGTPKATALSFTGGQTITLEATVYGLIGNYNYYINCKNTLLLSYISHK